VGGKDGAEEGDADGRAVGVAVGKRVGLMPLSSAKMVFANDSSSSVGDDVGVEVGVTVNFW
jgi:hypothetical protein